MAHPSDFSPAQQRLLLKLACQPPGQYVQPVGCTATVRSLRRRGLVEVGRAGAVRLAHNSNNTRPMNGGAPV